MSMTHKHPRKNQDPEPVRSTLARASAADDSTAPHTPLTDQQLNLDEIDARATHERLTPGPWQLDRESCDCGGDYPCGHGMYVVGIVTTTPTWSAVERQKRTGEKPHSYDFHRSEMCDFTDADWELMAHAREDVPALVAEVRRLRDELAEVKAANDPRLRCLIIKPDRDKDLYVGWSSSCDMPAGVWSRETAIEYGFPPSRLDRADENGSSATNGYTSGHWDDDGFVAEQLGWLPRARLGDYAVEYLHGDRQAAYALLEPFEGETEVRSPAAP